MTRNFSDAITSGAFVKAHDSVVLLGDGVITHPLCTNIAEACRNVGQSIVELNGITDMANVAFDSPAATSDLLIVHELPQDGEHQVGMGTAWSASKALGAVLFRRAETGKSTLIASSEHPRNWALLNRLGPDTFWLAASLGIGLLLDVNDSSHQKYFAGTNVPANHRSRELFDTYSVATMDCVAQHLHAEFDRDSYRPDWQWIILRASE